MGGKWAELSQGVHGEGNQKVGMFIEGLGNVGCWDSWLALSHKLPVLIQLVVAGDGKGSWIVRKLS